MFAAKLDSSVAGGKTTEPDTEVNDLQISADILRGYTDLIILRQLTKQDSYGYQINREVSSLSEGNLTFREATLYTAFRRLEEAGDIESYWGNEQTGARRRYYRLTEKGRAHLREDADAWLKTRELLNRLILDEAPEQGRQAPPVIEIPGVRFRS